MAYDIRLADRVREYLASMPLLKVEEKKMFRGLAFLINGKMCVNVSGDKLMCRFDPERLEEVAEKRGFQPMIMKGKVMKGYCYVDPEGIRSVIDFNFWVDLSLSYNDQAKSSKTGKKKK